MNREDLNHTLKFDLRKMHKPCTSIFEKIPSFSAHVGHSDKTNHVSARCISTVSGNPYHAGRHLLRRWASRRLGQGSLCGPRCSSCVSDAFLSVSPCPCVLHSHTQVPLLAGDGGEGKEAPLSKRERQVSKSSLFAPRSHFTFLTRNNTQSTGFLLPFLTSGQPCPPARERKRFP